MLLEFEHNFQHMKEIGGLKVCLERNHHMQRKVCALKN
jgi:hypothetical protein